MRVLQLIDSLRPGGAEKMAVSYANALVNRINSSYLCCTRKEGLLKAQLSSEVGYLFLNKRNALEPKAVLKLRKFIQDNRLEIIQAHSSSWFLALVMKISLPGLKVVWHDHYGRELKKRKTGFLKPASKFFDGILSVNEDLKKWAGKNLYQHRKIMYIRNFIPEISIPGEQVQLLGGRSFKIICVANVRPQKDHLNLLKAFLQVLEKYPDTSLHLVGKDKGSPYTVKIKDFIKKNKLQGKVFFYGEQENIPYFLKQANLGVLSSASEGLPLALLEYGKMGLAVVCTDVGQCKEVLGVDGKVVPSRHFKALAVAILHYREDENRRKKDAAAFKKRVAGNFSEEAVMKDLLWFFTNLKSNH